jgi:hypothetical protein
MFWVYQWMQPHTQRKTSLDVLGRLDVEAVYLGNSRILILAVGSDAPTRFLLPCLPIFPFVFLRFFRLLRFLFFSFFLLF